MKTLKVVLVTGFLGAGKTTLLNQMLRYLGPKNIDAALLINDFGKVNIDVELVDKKYSSNIYEVSQGSIFCVCTRDQFFIALDEIIKREPAFDLMIIEATGIANTGDLNEYLNESDYANSLAVIENICLIDALHFHKVLATLPAVKNQVEEATTCVVNKIDMAEDAGIHIDELEDTLTKINSQAKIIRAEYANIDFKDIFEKSFYKKWVSHTSIKKGKPHAIYTVSLESKGFIKTEAIQSLIAGIESPLLRAKGFFENDEGTFFIEYIGNDLKIRPYYEDIHKNNRVVLIGGKMDEHSLQKKFTEATNDI